MEYSTWKLRKASPNGNHNLCIRKKEVALFIDFIKFLYTTENIRLRKYS